MVMSGANCDGDTQFRTVRLMNESAATEVSMLTPLNMTTTAGGGIGNR